MHYSRCALYMIVFGFILLGFFVDSYQCLKLSPFPKPESYKN